MRKTGNTDFIECSRRTIIYSYIICPQCKEIPEISFILDYNEIKVTKYCKCSNTSGFLSSFDTLFDIKEIYLQKKCIRCYKDTNTKSSFCSICKGYLCSSCSSKKHNEHNNPLIYLPNTKCLVHKNKYSYYCYDCNEDLCNQCIHSHKFHEYKKYKAILSCSKLKQIEDEIYEWHSEYSKYLLKLREQVKEIYSFLDKREKSNLNFSTISSKIEHNLIECNTLFRYIKIFITTCAMFSDNLNHKIIFNVLNNTQKNHFTISIKNYFEYKEKKLIRFLNNNSFIHIPKAKINIQQIESIKTITTYKQCNCIIPLNDGRFVSCYDHTLVLYNQNFEEEKTINDKYNKIDLIYQLNDNILITCDNNIVCVWSINPLKKIYTEEFSNNVERKVAKIDKFSDKNSFIIISQSVYIYSYDEDNDKKPLKYLTSLNCNYPIINAVAFHYRKMVLAYSHENSLWFIEPIEEFKYKKCMSYINISSNSVNSLYYRNNNIYSCCGIYFYVISAITYQIVTKIEYEKCIEEFFPLNKDIMIFRTQSFFLSTFTLKNKQYSRKNMNVSTFFTLAYINPQNISIFEIFFFYKESYLICKLFNNINLYHIYNE